MVLDRSRRAFLATVGMVGLARGVEGLLPTDRPTAERPDSCPVSTLEDFDPPDRVLRSTVVSFVREYEEAYVRSEFIEYPHEMDEVTVYVLSVSPVDAGYAVEVTSSISDYRVTARIHADALAESVTGDLSSVAELESDAIREVATEAVDEFRDRKRGSASTRVGTGGSEWNALPIAVRRDLAAAPGDERGSYVTADGVLVRLRLETRVGTSSSPFHGPNGAVWYYVDTRIVRRTLVPWRRSRNVDPGDARDGDLLEC